MLAVRPNGLRRRHTRGGVRRLVAVAYLGQLIVSAATAGDSPPAPVESVVCLTTDTYPAEDIFQDVLKREIVRQAVLVAAREELGVLTRDETLGEPFPEGAGRSVYRLALRARFDETTGGWNAALTVADETDAPPLWEGQGNYGKRPKWRYQRLVKQVSKSVPAIAEALRKHGVAGVSHERSPEASPPSASVEAQLLRMDFVSQYAAAREAHHALRNGGASPAWSAVLVRAYANLSALVDHTWSSHSEALAARSLLYAQRELLSSGGSRDAHWLRAYASSVIGLHALAEEEVNKFLAKGQDDGLQDDGPPAWAAIVLPISTYDHKALVKCAAESPELRETIDYLQWRMYFSYLHDRWVHDEGLHALQACPEAYGVYAALAAWPTLGIKRLGDDEAVEALRELAPDRIATLEGLPESVTQCLSEPVGDGSRQEAFQQVASISQALVGAAADDGEFSWGVLGRLLAEEQFVAAANLIIAAGDAVEHSREPLVAELRPLFAGHRYAPYLESLALPRNEVDAIRATLSQIDLVDPRPCMVRLFHAAWGDPKLAGKPGWELGRIAIQNSPRTAPAYVNAYNLIASRWTNSIPQEMREGIMRGLAPISPHSPLARRSKLLGLEGAGPEQLAELLEGLGDDPVAWRSAGDAFRRLGDDKQAIECLRRSLAISPSFETTTALADAYERLDELTNWESTLTDYLQLEPLGLEDASINKRLASGYADRRAWKKAEPYALQAAGSYSAWGLLQASRVYEGMQDWPKSEGFVSQASQAYPSGANGSEWFEWTVRTGRGDRQAAHAIAQRSIDIARRQRNFAAVLRVVVFEWINDNLARALELAEQDLQHVVMPNSAEPWNRVFAHFVAASIAAELDDDAAINRAIDGLRGWVDSDAIQKSPEWVDLIGGIADAFQGDKPTAEDLARYDETFAGVSTVGRCNFSFFLAVALERLEEPELADRYYAMAAFQPPPPGNYGSTLAGRCLVERHGPSRGGLPDSYAAKEKAAQQLE